MLNIDGARVAALKKVSKIESKGGLQLGTWNCLFFSEFTNKYC
jgi:thiamine phosphate synthase YjbQ (UPF0047 family)